MIHGPDVSWFGAFEWGLGAGRYLLLLSAAPALLGFGLFFLLAWRKGPQPTGDAQQRHRTSLRTRVTAWPDEILQGRAGTPSSAQQN